MSGPFYGPPGSVEQDARRTGVRQYERIGWRGLSVLAIFSPMSPIQHQSYLLIPTWQLYRPLSPDFPPTLCHPRRSGKMPASSILPAMAIAARPSLESRLMKTGAIRRDERCFLRRLQSDDCVSERSHQRHFGSILGGFYIANSLGLLNVAGILTVLLLLRLQLQRSIFRAGRDRCCLVLKPHR